MSLHCIGKIDTPNWKARALQIITPRKKWKEREWRERFDLRAIIKKKLQNKFAHDSFIHYSLAHRFIYEEAKIDKGTYS